MSYEHLTGQPSQERKPGTIAALEELQTRLELLNKELDDLTGFCSPFLPSSLPIANSNVTPKEKTVQSMAKTLAAQLHELAGDAINKVRFMRESMEL